jgi:ADP-ribosyl-[dinitrogen reductase] hydrolase
MMAERPSTLADRALGAYLGLAIGDALGATVEFMTAREIAQRYAEQGGLHRDIVGGGWLKLPAGQVTDDTTMSLALGDALLLGERSGRPFDTRLMADGFVAWWRARPVDCGSTCRRGIQRYLTLGTEQGEANDGDAGNGALMRNLPVALATLGDDEAFARVSIAQAHITHHHALSDAAVLGLGQLLRTLMLAPPAVRVVGSGAASSVDGPDARCVDWCQQWVGVHRAFRFQPYPGRASAYVVDTVQTVLHHLCLHTDFEAALVATVNRGDDADTTGALLGMLAGARCGAQALPRRWLRQLAPAVVQQVSEQTQALLALARRRTPSLMT